MNKLSAVFIAALAAFFMPAANAISIVSDPYPDGSAQPTHCRLIFEQPALPDRVTPVETLTDGTVRCAWSIDDVVAPGALVDIRVAATAQDQATGVESAQSPFFDLSASGGPITPSGLTIEY